MNRTLSNRTVLSLVSWLQPSARAAESQPAVLIHVLRRRDDHCGHPEGNDARVLAEHPCRSGEGGKRARHDVIWRGPLREDDRDSQVSEVEGFISRGVSGIALAPLDEGALVGPVADARGRRFLS